MEALKPVFTTYQFDVEVVTPVHVGMAQEKNYVRGLDYVLEPNGRDATIKYLNNRALLDQLKVNLEDINEYSIRLAAGRAVDIESFLRRKKLITGQTISKTIPVQGQPDEIRRMYQTGLGQFMIPGSSLKGSIRSIIYATLKSRLGHNATELQMFGAITDNLMRYLQVSDTRFTETDVQIYATKVFSGDGDPKANKGHGTWKYKGGKGSHSDDFSEQGFSFFYEAVIPESKSTLILRLPTNLPQTLRTHAFDHTPNFDLLDKKPGAWLLDLIRSHTESYLKKEADYYAKFPNIDLDKLTSIKDRIQDLLSRNQQPNSCLLRVGAGVGNHSITGDWQLRSRDHFTDWNNRDYSIMNKTRKFAFTYSEEQKDYVFYPMGFIKLALNTK